MKRGLIPNKPKLGTQRIDFITCNVGTGQCPYWADKFVFLGAFSFCLYKSFGCFLSFLFFF